MNVYYIGNETHRIDPDPSASRLWGEFLDAIAALESYKGHAEELQSRISDKEDDNADLRDKVAELEARIAELEAEAGER